MKMFKSSLLLAGIFLIAYSTLNAQYSYTDIKKAAIEFTKSYIQNVYNGGSNQRVCVVSYTQDDYELKININMTWDGDIISSNHYEESGLILIQRDIYDKVSVDFKSTYRNRTASDFRTTWNAILGGAVALAVIGELSK